jgi:tetratricopeptide (TPR) repeat protein
MDLNVLCGSLQNRALARPKLASLILFFLILICLPTISLFADELYSKNKAAAKHYEKGNYDEALKSYDNLILEYPQEPKLKMNKGSAQFKLGDYDKAEESYNAASSTKDKKALADMYYNQGNAQYMQADRMASQGDNKSMEKYKAALENYIKSLDVRPSDKDAKWNVQLVQKKIKQMQQQQNNKDNKNDKNVGPSEYARKMKAKADEEVAKRNYKGAGQIMDDLMRKDQTAAAFGDYIKRLGDVNQIYSK